jgi:glycosyltransferase involved in cell wall biosynthesis
MLSRLFNPGTRVVYTNHFILANNLITRISNRLITPLQAGIIAVCNRGRERMIANGVDGNKIKVLFNAVDPEFWGKPEASTLRSEFGIDDDTMVLLCASRFAHDKGHRYLLHSIAKLREITDRKFILVLAGDGPLLEEIKELTKKLGLEKYILYTGFRSDIKNLFNGSDIYINSSEHEASSFNIIEALATGLPVIATDKGGNNDIINEQNDCGILVQYEDADDTAAAIKRLIEDSVLRDRLSKNALKAVDEKFNLVKMAEKTYNLYEEFTRKYQAKESIK